MCLKYKAAKILHRLNKFSRFSPLSFSYRLENIHTCLKSFLLAAMIDAKIFKDPVTGKWSCSDCDYNSQHQTNLRNHIEVYHVASQGYFCPVCSKICKTKNALSIHKSRNKHWVWEIKFGFNQRWTDLLKYTPHWKRRIQFLIKWVL